VNAFLGRIDWGADGAIVPAIIPVDVEAPGGRFWRRRIGPQKYAPTSTA
jgi:hypothetical protein